MEDPGIKELLQLAEKYADDNDYLAALQTALADARRRFGIVLAGLPSYHPADAAREAVLRTADFAYNKLFYEANDDCPYPTWAATYTRYALEAEDDAIEATLAVMAQQVTFIHDIIGNPFRPVTSDPAWFTWQDGTIPKLAQSNYEERALDSLRILADALEKAGCTNADILAHCRQPGVHVRGCWVIDLLTGRN
jgi:hypothetical protein